MAILKLITELGIGFSFSVTTHFMVMQHVQLTMGNVGLNSMTLLQILMKRQDTMLSRPIMTITQSYMTALIIGTVLKKAHLL